MPESTNAGIGKAVRTSAGTRIHERRNLHGASQAAVRWAELMILRDKGPCWEVFRGREVGQHTYICVRRAFKSLCVRQRDGHRPLGETLPPEISLLLTWLVQAFTRQL